MASRTSHSERLSALLAFLEGEGAPGLGAFMARQRWFAARGRRPTRLAVPAAAALDAPAAGWPAEPLVVLLMVETDSDSYYVPLAAHSGGAPGEGEVVGTVGGITIVDAHGEPEFGRRLLHACATGRVLDGLRGASSATGPERPRRPTRRPAGRLPSRRSRASRATPRFSLGAG